MNIFYVMLLYKIKHEILKIKYLVMSLILLKRKKKILRNIISITILFRDLPLRTA